VLEVIETLSFERGAGFFSIRALRMRMVFTEETTRGEIAEGYGVRSIKVAESYGVRSINVAFFFRTHHHPPRSKGVSVIKIRYNADI
jgi:hypothetical protein